MKSKLQKTAATKELVRTIQEFFIISKVTNIFQTYEKI